MTKANKGTQLSALRNLSSEPFDYLAAVSFDETLNVAYAGLIPKPVVRTLAVYRAHINAHTFYFRPSVLQAAGVRDISSEVRVAMLA